jgi:pentatricopeptide repeat protein
MCANYENKEAIKDIANSLLEYKRIPEARVYEMLLTEYAKRNDIFALVDVYNQMTNNNVPLNLMMCDLLIEKLSNCIVESQKQLLETLKEKKRELMGST